MFRRHRHTLSALLTASFLVGAMATTSTAHAAVAPRSTFTGVTLDGHAGFVMDVAPQEYLGSQVTVDAQADSVSLVGTNGTTTGQVVVSAPTGGTLTAGTTYDALGTPDATHGTIVVYSRQGAGCSYTGSFTVHQIGRDASGKITSFAASYSAACEVGAEPIVGEMRLNSTMDYVRFGDLALDSGSTKTVTVTPKTDATFGAASMTGPSPVNFDLGADTCSNHTVAAGTPCTVTITGWPMRTAPSQGTLSIPATVGDPVLVPMDILGHETSAGAYTSTVPTRILDTRIGLGAAKAKLGAGRTINLQVSGHGGLPSASQVRAVVLNLTVTGATAASYVTAYPTGQSRPTTSSLNFLGGWTRANLVTVPVSSTGQVSLYNNAGSTNVIADVQGYYTTASTTFANYGSYHAGNPTRIYDSRLQSGGRLLAGWYQDLWVNYNDTINPHITAVAINLTATAPTGSGNLTAYNGDESQPLPVVSNVNFTKNQTVPNMAIVPVHWLDNGSGTMYPSFAIANTSPSASTQFVVDVVGYYDDNQLPYGARFTSLPAPRRVVDSRTGLGTTPLGPKVTHTIIPPLSLASLNVAALVANVTTYKPTAATYLTLWPAGSTRPSASNTNPYAGQTVAAMAMPVLGQDNGYSVYNNAGTTGLILDVAGTLDNYPALSNSWFAPHNAAAPSTTLAPRDTAHQKQPASGGVRSASNGVGPHRLP